MGYLGYSLYTHVRGRGPPRSAAVVALAVGTQFPDLVDKPLSWMLGILPSGHSMAHSLLVAVPLALLAVQLGSAIGRKKAGAAFAFGYLSHLPGDVVYPAMIGGKANVGFLFWPLVPAPESEASVGFVEMVRTLFGQYLTEILTGQLSAYIALEICLLLSVFLLWLYDGLPPFRALVGWGRGRARELSSR